MKIAACLILKDSGEKIEGCIASIRPFVDEINVYDTGSTDNTIELLEQMNEYVGAVYDMAAGKVVEERKLHPEPDATYPEGHGYAPYAPIRVERGEWRNDFSWAREQSWAMVSDDVTWYLWLDDDDLIYGAENFRPLAATADPSIDGFICHYNYAQDGNGSTVCELWRERLIRRSAGFTWRGSIHEVLVPPEGHQPSLLMIPKEQVSYIHGRPAERYDPERNLKILMAEKQRADETGEQLEPRTLAYLGTELMAKERFIDAIPFLQSYLERPDAAWSDERMQVAHKLAACFRLVGNPLAAVEIEGNALKERVSWGETHVGLCESYAALGKWEEVEHYAKLALQAGQPQSMLILNPHEFTLVPLTRLAEACVNTGRPDEALAWLEKAKQIAPNHPYLLERQASYEATKMELQLVTATLGLREALVRHDENLKALNVLENVPYLIANHPLIVKARADQREMCKHYLRPDEYLRWYCDEPKESSLTDDHIDMVGEAFGRVGGLLEGLKEQEIDLGRKPKLLDLGCNDFWMGEFFWRQGFHTDGVELNRKSYDLALERRERFGRDDALIVHGDLHDAENLLGREYGNRSTGKGENYSGPRLHLDQYSDALQRWVLPDELKYDAVSLFEVLEHVPDVERTLKVMESLVRPGGRVYISTPDGAFERGNLPAWQKVELKGHLRAIPIDQLADLLNERGRIEQLEQTNGDRVAFASYTPQAKKSKIVFYAGASWEPWSPASINTTGLGGSETALVQISVRLAQEGHDVRVYSGAEPGVYAGALFRPHTAFDPTEESDLLIVSRMPHIFDNPIGAKRTALWCHDHSYPAAMTPERAEKIDQVVVLTDWQRDRFARLYPYLDEKLVTIRNGISYRDAASGETRFPDGDRPFAKRKPRCVFSSSADRGLDVMLEVWPEIREQVPNAELHVFYGFDVLNRVAMTNPELFAYKVAILNRIQELGSEEGGVFARGRVGQHELYAEMQEARVWSYPTSFLETSCIGAMEARAAGLPIVTSNLAALQETVGSHGQLIPWVTNDDGVAEDEPHNRSPEYKSWFVREVVRLLSDGKHWNEWHRRALAGVGDLDWANRVPEWEALVAAEVREAVAA